MYVYELINPKTNETFYVGKGSGKRHLHHHKEAMCSQASWTNVEKCKTILNILDDGLSIIYKIHKHPNETAAFVHERELIRKYGRICNGTGILTNMLPGGKGGCPQPVFVFNRSDGSFFKRYASHSDASADLHVPNSSISDSLSGKSCGSRNYLFSHTSISPTLNIKPNINVYELPHKRLIGSYTSTHLAAKSLKVSQTLIFNSLAGIQPKFLRKYIVTYDNQPIPLMEVLVRITPDTGEQKLYASSLDAYIDIQVDASSVWRSVKSGGKFTAKGYLWYKLFV